MKIYDFPLSPNCRKVRRTEISMRTGGARTTTRQTRSSAFKLTGALVRQLEARKQSGDNLSTNGAMGVSVRPCTPFRAPLLLIHANPRVFFGCLQSASQLLQSALASRKQVEFSYGDRSSRLPWGSRGRRFESCRLDYLSK